MQPGKLYIVSAPSGAGKSTLVKALTDRLTDTVVSVSYTTRSPRPQEEEGKNYHFISPEVFKTRIQEGDFLEYAVVFNKIASHYYGTSQKWVDEKLALGQNVILEIDWQGARQVKARRPDAISVFILPPALKTLEERLIARGQDSPETIAQRMSVARDEISHCQEYDYCVVNEDFDLALQALIDIFQGKTLPVNWQAAKEETILLASLLQ